MTVGRVVQAQEGGRVSEQDEQGEQADMEQESQKTATKVLEEAEPAQKRP